jgi:predicted phosphoadenosine phosphosulfate sulfurtransferase
MKNSAPSKKPLGISVLQAARQRIEKIFNDFPRIYVSYSAGKDSTVMLAMVVAEAAKRGRKIGVLLVDLEAQYSLTIQHAEEMIHEIKDHIDLYWVALPLNLRNAVSQFEPQWCCWEHGKEGDWVRQPPTCAITDQSYFPFFRQGMEFEEFVPAFGEWYAQGKLCACFVGIRTDESLNRWRTIAAGKKQSFDGLRWTTKVIGSVYNAYPIYDWATEDIWRFHAKTGIPYNKLYDRMHQAGLSIHQARICQPYGDDQRRGLWLYHLIEPDTWGRVLARVAGANSGALYVQESGNVMGNLKITKPAGHTWESFAKMILDTMPPSTAEHYRNKITMFLKWYGDRGSYAQGIPDDGPMNCKKTPSWKRICKALLRNDYWCKGLSFSQQKTEAFKRYQKIMKERRLKWNLI